ncbi:MAG: DUF971 domain-containing protein [Planctomycetes bacterium]|nr:DUF971 domain-containing protein [Planctomycetota bacterium]MBL7037868.1 DUF971 domain-containing protein [Pirellulaceae bacterium]
MHPYPTALEIIEDSTLEIDWSDGERRRYTFRELRDHCPCALCDDKPTGKQQPTLLPVLSATEAQPLRIQGMKPVGNYAYAIAFSDGHDTGIFRLEYLRHLGEAVT